MAVKRAGPCRESDPFSLSETSYRNQFASNSAVMLFIDPANGMIIDANGAADRFYGYPRAQFLSMKITDISVLPAVDVWPVMAAALSEEGKQFYFQHRIADGSVREVEVSASSIRFARNVVLHLIIFDITDRRLAEAVLRDAEKNARLFTHKILSVREEEKKKLSVNLHDEIGTMAVSLSAELGVVQAELEKNNIEGAIRGIQKTKALLKREVDVFRKIAHGLRPPNMDIVGLAGVLKEYFSEIAGRHHLSVRFTADSGEKIEDRGAIAIYRITQEAVTNIIKHARARRVFVRLRYHGGKLIYTIRDDGRGFDEMAVTEDRGSFKMGILGMKERAEAVGAKLTLVSEIQKGTIVRVVMPLCGVGV